MSDPADLINVAIEHLIQQRFELPAFQTLDRLVSHVRYAVHQTLYTRMTATLSEAQKTRLDALISVHAGRSEFTRIKDTPRRRDAQTPPAVDGAPHVVGIDHRPAALSPRHCPHQDSAVCRGGRGPRLGRYPRDPAEPPALESPARVSSIMPKSRHGTSWSRCSSSVCAIPPTRPKSGSKSCTSSIVSWKSRCSRSSAEVLDHTIDIPDDEDSHAGPQRPPPVEHAWGRRSAAGAVRAGLRVPS